jgi:hypothetical protein
MYCGKYLNFRQKERAIKHIYLCVYLCLHLTANSDYSLSNGWITVDDEQERIWKEATVA